jgi:hypothetical protein
VKKTHCTIPILNLYEDALLPISIGSSSSERNDMVTNLMLRQRQKIVQSRRRLERVQAFGKFRVAQAHGLCKVPSLNGFRDLLRLWTITLY